MNVKQMEHLFEQIAALEEQRRELGEQLSDLWKRVRDLGVSPRAARELYRRRYRLPLDVVREVEQLELALGQRSAA